MFWIICCFVLVASAVGQNDTRSKLLAVSSVRGENALFAWPWQVSLKTSKGIHFCGGTLINKNWILTAAHCSVQAGYHHAVLGEHDRGSDDEAVQINKISKVIVHPRFNKDNFNNDVALLRLSSPAQITSRVSPVKLVSSTTSISSGTLCVLTGWGRTATGLSPRILQETTLPIVSTSNCKLYWGLIRTITDSMICAGGSGSSACQGDSGGPLLCDSKGVWYQVGIVSWGAVDCSVKSPGVYSRVSFLRKWIDQTVSSN
ncbi:chymotrypsin-like protease CTRL-1 [Triplophysa rosa]|uniref:Chymotrypsin-like n=1 Tax=Triplophysa rosa TaxID=992332 RepID=A0A9W7WIX7_TRIRA|nr:chymotrypsin-like protease CTRL-1 [Triplophysa rosa]KAI7801196.1 chymotrypsin-like precursor [Triplophysa rosa]